MLIAMLLSAALADTAEPTVTHAPQGGVQGRIVLKAPADHVRSILSDGASVASHSLDVVRADAMPQGACERVDLQVRGIFSPFHVRTLRCPQTGGWTEELVDGGVFSMWQGDWTVRELPEGTEVVYTIQTRVDLPVSQHVVDQRTARSVTHNLNAVALAVDAGGW